MDEGGKPASAKRTTVEAKIKECMEYFDSRGNAGDEERVHFLLEVSPIYREYLAVVDAERTVRKRKCDSKSSAVVTDNGDGWVTVKTGAKEKTIPANEAIRLGYRIAAPPRAAPASTKEDKAALRGRIYDEFMTALRRMTFLPEHIVAQGQPVTQYGNLYGFCPECNVNMVEDAARADMICTKCSVTLPAIPQGIESCPYGTSVNNADYCYKRINHLNECIAQFHARERSMIPDDVVDAVDKEFKKMRIDRAGINAKNVRKVLRKLRLPRYFEHSVQITHILNGVPPPTMTLEQEEKLRNMFRSIQKPFEDICPKNRKNFLNYSYTLHKMCQLQGYDEFLDHFPLLKSKEKLWGQDVMWKGICAKLNWQFIPST